MRRRAFLRLASAAAGAAVWPVAARTQAATPVVGFLSSRSPGESRFIVEAFKQGLREAGYVEGQNVTVEYHWAEGQYGQLPALATELVARHVALIFAAGGPASVLAAKAATSTIPIVFPGTDDPVRLGLVASLSHPGGNATGLTMFSAELGAKRLELIKELIPGAREIAYLSNPASPSAEMAQKDMRAAAAAIGIDLRVVHASAEAELEAAFAQAIKVRAGGLVVQGDPFFDTQREKLVTLAARYAVPAIYAFREYVEAGGLMSYGTSITDSYRRAGIYVGRILKGEKPADLPVVQPSKFDLSINVKTAKALGVAIPPSLLTRADEVIE